MPSLSLTRRCGSTETSNGLADFQFAGLRESLRRADPGKQRIGSLKAPPWRGIQQMFLADDEEGRSKNS